MSYSLFQDSLNDDDVLWIGIFINLSPDPSVMDEEARWYSLEDSPMLQVSFTSQGSGMSR
jgi:hypothetical protein